MALTEWTFTRLFTTILLLTPIRVSLAQTSSSNPTTGAAAAAKANTELDAQDSKSESKEVTTLVGTRTLSIDQGGLPSGSYTTYTSKITIISSTETIESDTTLTFTSSDTSSTIASNATETSTGAEPKNTQPCNNYVELCDKKYSNVTAIAAHNSPFVRKGSSAANQQLDVVTQLNDGVRFLQAQIQWPSPREGENIDPNVPHFCHTSCDILDGGPITEWLTTVREWVESHPYDVVTILLGNGNYSKPALYAPFIESTGILKYAYQPPFLPMSLDDWPTLEQMIILGKRVVMFLDYEADQKEYPWLVDQFSNMWETPFDPLDRAFPCDVQRPPDLGVEDAKDRLYLMNHNLNAKFVLFGAEILVPAVALLNETNAAEGEGSLGNATQGCAERYGRAPNFLNVDYYNFGKPEGSVFEVAARFNNVTWNGRCCGTMPGAASGVRPRLLMLGLGFVVTVLLLG